MVDISTVGIVPVPKGSTLETRRRELSEDVWFGIGTVGTLLVVEQSTLENRPRGCVVHTPSYTVTGIQAMITPVMPGLQCNGQHDTHVA